jgi:hypothetical protein
MAEKPKTAHGYGGNQSRRVKAACLYLATKLGDLMEDMVVVGGLVPSLIIDQENLAEAGTPHVGTMDLDTLLIAPQKAGASSISPTKWARLSK